METVDTISSETFIALASELADSKLREIHTEMEIDEERDGMTCYTEAAQELHNQYYDEYQEMILSIVDVR